MVTGAVWSLIQAVVYSVLMYVFMTKKGYFSASASVSAPSDATESPAPDKTDETEERNEPEKAENDDDPKKDAAFLPKHGLILAFVMLAASFGLDMLMYKYLVIPSDDILSYIKVSFANALCFAAMLTDIKREKIPNELILCGALFRAVIYAAEFVTKREEFLSMLKFDGAAFMIGFVLLFLIGICTKGLGFGDVKLLGVLALLMSLTGILSVLFVTLLLSSLAGIALIAAKKKNIKSGLPMAPFIYIGVAVTEILGTF